MGKSTQFIRYRLGIDVGVASLGAAVVALDEADYVDGSSIVFGAVRTYPIPLGAEDRRLKRGARRNNDREGRRLNRVTDLLVAKGIGYSRGKEPEGYLNRSPIKCRAQASREKVQLEDLARALLHIAKHRGSSAIRERETEEQPAPPTKQSSATKKKKQSPTKAGMETLQTEMQARGFETYGQYLRWREKQKTTLPTRINSNAVTGEYAYYPSRDMLRHEFDKIWTTQARFHGEVLNDALRQEVEAELFFQRRVSAPPPAQCPYFYDEPRLPKCSRLFQVRRIYEEANNLRFKTKSGETAPYGLIERDKIVARLLSGEDLNATELKATLGLPRTYRVSLENAKSRTGIAGYPFDVALGDNEVLGLRWYAADEALRDSVLGILAHVYDDDLAMEQLQSILGCDHQAAAKILSAKIPSGWGHMGITATTKILGALKTAVISSREAEDIAGLVHAMTADGVVYSKLPYYGEVLPGHTVNPIWVSDYRRATDKPPLTDPLEKKFGRIPNPVVHLALNQIRLVVNDIIDKFGPPEIIHIELARELNKSAEDRARLDKENADNRKTSDAAAKALEGINIKPTRTNIQKYKLWAEQGHRCLYTGANISLTQLYSGDADIDHILPRSKTYSDAMSNKAVCLRHANADKSNRAPYEAFAENPKYDWDAIMRQVADLPGNKQWRFDADAMTRFEEDENGFRERYGNDNSYIARVAGQYLCCLYGGEPQHTVAVSSYIVSLLRGKWGLNKIFGTKDGGGKSRDDHRHHFIDALTTAFATRGMVQAIQREAARCEWENLTDFVERIDPPFGEPRAFFAHVREAVADRVRLSRKPDHATQGQLHQDTLLGIIDGPDEKGSYVCRLRKSLFDYNTLDALMKPSVKTTLPDLPEIVTARGKLEALKQSIASYTLKAETALEVERQADIAAGNKGRKISPAALYARAVKLHKDAGGTDKFTLFEKNKLVNTQRAQGGNKATGGFISGRNHRLEVYQDRKGQTKWQCVSMLEANDKYFQPQSEQDGNRLLWKAHKEDILLIDHPDDPARRIQVVVAKFRDIGLGVTPIEDARDSKSRVLWEKGLSFFVTHRAQRVVVNAAGDITWHFPMLSHANGKT